MKPDAYKLLMQCIETGIGLGWRRAHKHNDAPDEQYMRDAVKAAVMDAICEWFSFDGDEDARQF